MTAFAAVIGCGVCWLVRAGGGSRWLWLVYGIPAGVLIGAASFAVYSLFRHVHPEGTSAMLELGAANGLWSGVVIACIMACMSQRLVC